MNKEQPIETRDLAYRYASTAMAIEAVKDAIKVDPDIEGFSSLVDSLSKKYNFNQEQISYFRNIGEQYEQKHQAVKKYREMYPDDKDLFKVCFGSEPEGEVVVIEGPLTFHFRCFNVNDYVRAGRWKDGKEINKDGRAWLEKTAALALIDTKLEDLGSGTVSIENVTWMMEFSKPKDKEESAEERERREKDQSERSRLHEEQHQLNRLFKPIDNSASAQDLIANFRQSEQTAETIKSLLGNLIKTERRFIEYKLWDEVLALYRGGRKRADDLCKVLKADVYNYRKRHKSEISEIPKKVYETISNEGIAVSLEEIQKETDNIFGEEYERDLHNWLNVVNILETKGYGSDEILNYLCQENINNWPNLAETVPSKKSTNS